MRRLKRVDLPTLGLPARAIVNWALGFEPRGRKERGGLADLEEEEQEEQEVGVRGGMVVCFG